ncbi:hypothetical protein ACE3MQ_04905 [Paenibacillus lentus]|uniref:hypothetical protein n=1 Tax=Paenibacillus lentus TaxID=1338368 RepID=UPI00364691A2
MVNYEQLSTILQWLFIIFLLIISLYMFRKLNERSPQPASHQDPEKRNSLALNNIFPVSHLIDITDKPIQLHPVHAAGTILMLSVSGCSSCAKLYPNINAIAGAFTEYQVALIMIGTENEINDISNEHKIRIPIHRIEMHQMGNFGTFTFPFCYVLSNEGIILNKGHVQTVEEVSSLLSKEVGALNVKIS